MKRSVEVAILAGQQPFQESSDRLGCCCGHGSMDGIAVESLPDGALYMTNLRPEIR